MSDLKRCFFALLKAPAGFVNFDVLRRREIENPSCDTYDVSWRSNSKLGAINSNYAPLAEEGLEVQDVAGLVLKLNLITDQGSYPTFHWSSPLGKWCICTIFRLSQFPTLIDLIDNLSRYILSRSMCRLVRLFDRRLGFDYCSEFLTSLVFELETAATIESIHVNGVDN